LDRKVGLDNIYPRKKEYNHREIYGINAEYLIDTGYSLIIPHKIQLIP